MAFVAGSPGTTPSCFGSASSSSRTQCVVRRQPLPSFSSSSLTATARRRISMVATKTSLSLFPSSILLARGSRGDIPFLSSSTTSCFPSSIRLVSQSPSPYPSAAAAARNTTNANTNPRGRDVKRKKDEEDVLAVEEEEEEEEEENLVDWMQMKAVDLVGSVTQAIPGPRVGRSSMPWIVAIPLAYVSFSLLIAILTTLHNFTSPKARRRFLVNKNAMLCKSIDELLEKGRDGVQQSTFEGLMQKTGFGGGDILRKYIRYALNEKPFNQNLVNNLIELRKASSLEVSQVAQILNVISRRIVTDKGLVVMDMSGYSEKGIKRKIAVQTLFRKVYYLSEEVLQLEVPKVVGDVIRHRVACSPPTWLSRQTFLYKYYYDKPYLISDRFSSLLLSSVSSQIGTSLLLSSVSSFSDRNLVIGVPAGYLRSVGTNRVLPVQ
ncbi:hypothetical protein RHMOL_Rhmol04G0186900 [Rhododendron molle]|uniref:Uncharacterized protein n=1 Tax=Rhododendron molle TaxID=49168 RepID=A0ACC0P367_RHOML|nr:hypothetical protein RHMOL_Rhmol04G0186900 [Rhododendron molle]